MPSPKRLALTLAAILQVAVQAGDYPIVDTGQYGCYNASQRIRPPRPGRSFFGQDGQYQGNQPVYRDNRDGTVTDLVTRLMWQRDPGDKQTYQRAVDGVKRCQTGGYDDWRLPTAKELYSLILFSGVEVHRNAVDLDKAVPFLDASTFAFAYRDPNSRDRPANCWYATSTRYVGLTLYGDDGAFAVNFAKGRLEAQPINATKPGRPTPRYYALYVRGNPNYGQNDFQDNGDGTITDRATGLTWTKQDSGAFKAGPQKDGKMNWSGALAWCEGLTHAGHSDWRLPNAKELQSVVDYSRAPDATNSPAIDPIFECADFENEDGWPDGPSYWSSTTLVDYHGGQRAAYVAFGRGLIWTSSRFGGSQALDAHGAGCQRTDPKDGDPVALSNGRGPRKNVTRIYHFVRPVRGGLAVAETD